jgi:CBS domain-containing protein
VGLITETGIVRAVADGKDVNDVRFQDLMTTRPTVISAITSIRDPANP